MREIHHINTYYPNTKAGFTDTFGHGAHHGLLEGMATLPVTLFHMQNLMRGLDSCEQAAIKPAEGDLLRIFSNGYEAFVKVEK